MISTVVITAICFFLIILAVIVWRNYFANFLVSLIKVLALVSKLEFDWWAVWGFRTGFFLLVFCGFLLELIRLYLSGTNTWLDVLNLILLTFFVALLFGLVAGHIALMVYRITDREFVKKEYRKKRMSLLRQKGMKVTTTRKAVKEGHISFPDTVKYFFQEAPSRAKSDQTNVSFAKIIVFAILGSIIVFWILDVIILR